MIAADAERAQKLHAWANVIGVTGAPYDAWLTLRGLRTLFPRVERQQRTAGVIAEFLEQHSQLRAVHYPGLAPHPGHAVAASQQRGFGTMLSFELEGGLVAVRRFIGGAGTFTLAESLGVVSLIAHPATMTHADMGVEARRVAGISDALLRLSIGLEHEEDMVAGLNKGFGT